MSDVTLPAPGQPRPALAGRLGSDERLAKLVSRGQERAFATLYRRHHQALYRYCRAIVRDHEDAEDAVQNAMERALAALRHGERDLAVRPWLFRIAHNEAVTILRRRPRGAVSIDEAELAGLRAAPLDVEGAVAQREELDRLVSDLQALGERQRSALVMRELSGLGMEEIASALGTSPGAAKQLVFEARVALHDFAEGRAMDCEAVRRAISDGDRRVWRGRKVAAHARTCPGCREFQAALSSRRAELRALAPPLPAAASSALLARVLTHPGAGGHGGSAAAGGTASAAAGAGAAAGNHVAGALIAKGLAVAALAAGAAAGAVHLASGPPSHRVPGRAARGAGQEIQPARAGAAGPAAARATLPRAGASAPSHPRRASRSGPGPGASPGAQVRDAHRTGPQAGGGPRAAGSPSEGRAPHPARSHAKRGSPKGSARRAHGLSGARGRGRSPAATHGAPGRGRTRHQPSRQAPAEPPATTRAPGQHGGQGTSTARAENGRAR